MNDANETPPRPSPGAMLREARERQGLHVAALAAAIKMSPRKLEALEADRFDELPGATFTRALAQTVCRALKIDARPVLELMPPADAVRLDESAGHLNTPFRERPARSDGTLAGASRRPLWLAAAGFGLAALVVYVLPTSIWETLAPGVRPAATAPARQDAAVAPQGPSLPALSAAPAGAVAAAGVAGAASAASEASAATDAAPGASAAAIGFVAPAASAAAAAPLAPAAVPVTGILQLRTTAESWIEVRDKGGEVLVSRTLAAGEHLGIDGRPPLQVVVGNVAGTTLLMRGRAIDLQERARDNVARLELP